MKFPHYKQYDAMDCGPTCIRMIAKHYGKSFTLQSLRQKCQIQRNGVSILGISEASESIGFKTLAARLDYTTLSSEAILPCIVHWNQNHFVVVYKIDRSYAWLADPASGLIKVSKRDFLAKWISSNLNQEGLGVVLLLEPPVNFAETDTEHEIQNKLSPARLLIQLKKNKQFLFQLILGLIIGTLLQTALPFLTQSVVDVGIASKDINFITLVLIGQIMIFIGSTIIDFMRSWVLLHLSTRINISLLTDFFVKLMKLPMSYFDIKLTGDIIQRMGDHSRIQTFLTTNLLNTSFSIVSFVVFTFMAIAYDINLFYIFLAGSLVYLIWICLFLNVRKNIDFKRFALSSANQNITIEMIQGMQEIKLNNCERQKRWTWERSQAKLFKINIRSLLVNQTQSAGALFINQSKNILLTFLTAREVIHGNLTLGGMMAVQYIIGQLNSPVQQIIQFIQALQDARISLDRVNEIHEMEDEEPIGKNVLYTLPEDNSLNLTRLCFKYPGYDNENILQDIDLHIEQGKTTAIVGKSGSGKTTLLKILLRFYHPVQGEIRVGQVKMESISPSYWRSRCGVVMQEGYIFSDSIAANIAVGEETPDSARLLHAITIANVHDFIESLPLGLHTKIGGQGNGISYGQRQRILIARAVYKNPEYLFFDEATNSLDAHNEKVILENLQLFLKGKTVVVVAHRLSTVKTADKIIVLEKGKIIETGTHDELTGLKGEYYRLVKNQLELGN